MGRKKLTTEEFIKKAVTVHGDKYSYSKVEYVKSNRKIIIICPIHREFNQTPSNHLSGKGCPKCGKIKRTKTTKQFIKEAMEIHSNNYNYSKVEYFNHKTKVVITCSIHGEFMQAPHVHLQSAGCPKCGIKKVGDKTRRTIEQFLRKAKEVHKDKYDYSKVVYISNIVKVIIICNEHGEFKQTTANHLSGQGCPKCGFKNTIKSRLKTKKQFIKEAVEMHEDKYDYSKVKYINTKTKIIIVCPEHGEFKQIPSSHLRGHGCPKCKRSKGEEKIEKYLKDNNILFENQKTFKYCKYIKKLKFDFYLPDYNICIEYDGEQHFKSVKYFGGEKDFKKRLKRDKIKEKYCKENGIKLIRISYTEFNNMENILKEKYGIL